MTDSLLIKLIIALIGIISTGFYFIMNSIKSNSNKAHERIDDMTDKISEQSRHNAETYARRDDVVRGNLALMNKLESIEAYLRKGG